MMAWHWLLRQRKSFTTVAVVLSKIYMGLNAHLFAAKTKWWEYKNMFLQEK
jgi:hypothetical protein